MMIQVEIVTINYDQLKARRRSITNYKYQLQKLLLLIVLLPHDTRPALLTLNPLNMFEDYAPELLGKYA